MSASWRWTLGCGAALGAGVGVGCTVPAALPLAGAAALAGAAGLALAARRQASAQRQAAAICGDDPSAPLERSLARIAARLSGVEHRLAETHPVTRLPTREHLLARMEGDIAAEPGAPRLLGLLRFSDYDRLAGFDDAAANDALRDLAARVLAAVGRRHVVSHVNRDTVAIWFDPGAPDLAAAEFRAVAHVAAQEMQGAGRRLNPAIDAGAVRYPLDGQEAGRLLLRATAALTCPPGDGTAAAEPAGDACGRTDALREDFTLEQDLGRAIADGQLTVVFQPVVDLAAGRMLGAEALLRWDHPTLGAVSPARFIPVVERLGLGDRYGLWVLNAACREARRWQDEGLAGLKVAVNLSARQLLDPDLDAKIARTLRRHGLDARALELELTETAAMADAGRTRELFRTLRARGVSLAIDDFGSGYSSLSYLKNLPFDKLKIDREFVAGVDARRDSRAICRALIELGRGLDLLVLAEGVETAAEVETLRRLGCSVFQGFHFSKPLGGEAYAALARDPAWLSRLARPARAEPMERLSA